MKKIGFLVFLMSIAISCGVPKTEVEKMKEDMAKSQSQLKRQNQRLEDTNEELTARLNKLNEKSASLQATNQILLDNMGNLSALTKKGAENLEKSLEGLRERDNKINSLRDAISKKDSITFAVVKSLKGSLDNMDDEDVTINVEKGVVYISISDKMLFSSGSYKVNKNAKNVLSKVAKIVKDKPDFEFIVEGHTDNVPVKSSVTKDNWDLSVLRATSIVRILQQDYKVDPSRMSASGRSEYVNIADNSTASGRSRNRRIKVIMIPKLDQFYGMVEESLDSME